MKILLFSVVCALLINFVFVQETLSQVLVFNINRQNYECSSSVASLTVKGNETLTLSVLGPHINEANCSTSNSNVPFLTTVNFTIGQNEINSATASIPTAKHNGKWNCKFLIRKDKNQDGVPENKREFRNGSNFTRVDCSVIVNIEAPEKHENSTSGPLGLDQETFYILIGCIVGGVVIVIIIAQTVCIIYYKRRVELRNLSHLEQRPQFRRDDRTRYSTLPSRKCSKNRQSSRIYQSLENLRTGPPEGNREGGRTPQELDLVEKTPPNIKDRPPMPLPNFIDSDDEDSIYNVILEEKLRNINNLGGNTLSRIFTPAPPPLDSLPRRGNKLKHNRPQPSPKPKKPVHTNLDDMESYDYTDSNALSVGSNRRHKKAPPLLQKPTRFDQRNDIPLNVVNPKQVPPKPCPGAPVMMNELGNILKMRNNINARAAEAPQFEEKASPTHHQVARRPPPKEAYSPQQVRAPGFRGPQDMQAPARAWAPKPTFQQQEQPPTWVKDPRPQLPRYPQDRRPSDASYLQEDRRPSNSPRYPQEDRRPLEMSRRQEIRPQPKPSDLRLEGRAKGPPYRPLSPEMARAPHTPQPPIVTPMQTRSPPLPQKPNPGVIRSPLGIKKPLPPLPNDTDSTYEPIADGDSTDDEEWTVEELKDYHIYNQ